MLDEDEIHDLEKLLKTYRRTLQHYLQQRASFGDHSVPPYIINGIDECREHIQYIKRTLRKNDMEIIDHPYDEEHVPTSLLQSDVSFSQTIEKPKTSHRSNKLSSRLSKLISNIIKPDQLNSISIDSNELNLEVISSNNSEDINKSNKIQEKNEDIEVYYDKICSKFELLDFVTYREGKSYKDTHFDVVAIKSRYMIFNCIFIASYNSSFSIEAYDKFFQNSISYGLEEKSTLGNIIICPVFIVDGLKTEIKLHIQDVDQYTIKYWDSEIYYRMVYDLKSNQIFYYSHTGLVFLPQILNAQSTANKVFVI